MLFRLATSNSRHARRRIANNGGNRFRDVAEQSELSGFQFVVADVTAIADEVDGQLTRSMDGYMELKAKADGRGLARNARP